MDEETKTRREGLRVAFVCAVEHCKKWMLFLRQIRGVKFP